MKVRPNSRIAGIFSDVKARGLVEKHRRLVITRYLKGSRAFAGAILINERMADLEDSAILFILLHEEAHIANPQKISPYLLPAAPIAVLHAAATLSWAWLGGSLLLYQASAVLMVSYIILLLSVLRMRKDLLAEDELNADRMAVRQIRDAFDIDPSQYLLVALLQGGESGLRGPDFLRRLKRFFDIHPPAAERLQAVSLESMSPVCDG